MKKNVKIVKHKMDLVNGLHPLTTLRSAILSLSFLARFSSGAKKTDEPSPS
jgi:hypothetical protein